MNNEQLYKRAKELFPGGVHSPVRSFKGLRSSPRFIERGEGAYLFDVEKKDYIDFCMSFGPLILGHKNRAVHEAVKEALERGWSFGAAEPYSLELAEFITERISFIDQIRFMSSGTEAVMTALRLARGKTKRDKILKFSGCYHGHTDSMLIKAGSGLAGTSEASSNGIPAGIANDTLVCELGDEEAVTKLFAQNRGKIAAVIIEPLPANNGLLNQKTEFLMFLRKITEEEGTLLIFDEVISGFRVSFGGMAQRTGITPDLVTYGKIIGGGFPVGAVAGKKEIISLLAPVGDVYQAGTLSANPVAMVAGLATLKQLTPSMYETISGNTDKVVNVFNEWLEEYDEGKFSNYSLHSTSSLFWPLPTTDAVTSVATTPKNLGTLFVDLFETLLEKGVYLAPNAYEVGFVSSAHNDDVIQELEKRLRS